MGLRQPSFFCSNLCSPCVTHLLHGLHSLIAQCLCHRSLLRNNMHFWLAHRLHQKNQSIIKHFNAANKRSYQTKPGPACRKKKKPEEQKSEQKPKPNCTVNSKSSRIPSPSPSAYSQNQKDYDRRLETTVQLSIIIKHLKLKVRRGFVFLW